MVRIVVQKLSLLVVACALLAGCGSPPPPDLDNEQSKAMRITPGILVKDGVNAGRNDKVDWKDFSYYEDARATVVVAIGDVGKPHKVTGEISLLSFDGQLIEKQAVIPSKREYTFVFEAKKDLHYFLKINAVKGAAAYMIDCKVEIIDPCASCTPDQTCNESKQCIAKNVCVPECKADEVCKDNKCEDMCGGCPSGKRCEAKSGRCLSIGSGRTREPGVKPVKKGCDPACQAGEICNKETSECEASTSIAATVLTVTEESGGSVILLNQGSQSGVKRGASGSVGGGKFRFTIRDVTATRSRAKVSASPAQLKGLTKASISK